MKRISLWAALALLICNSAQAEWWVGLSVANDDTPSNTISVFDSQASGNTSPTTTIGGPISNLRSIFDFALDEAHDEMLVADFRGNQVVRYALDASGDLAPFISITHPNMSQPRKLLLIPQVNELAVLTSGSLLYLPADAVGEATAKRVALTFLSGLQNANGLAYLPETDEVAIGDNEAVNGVTQGEIRFYSRLDDGFMSATRILTGPQTRLGTGVLGLRHDPIRHELYVLVYDPAVNGRSPSRILVFADNAAGDVAPIREITGEATQLYNAVSLAIEPLSGEIAVGIGYAQVTPAVLFFHRTQQGNAGPIRQIGGPLTGLNLPNGVGAVLSTRTLDRMFSDSFE